MSKIKDTDYLTLSAMLRAKEAKMLGSDKLERLLTDPSYTDAAKALTDCGYEDMSAMDSREINEALARHLAAAIAEIDFMTTDKTVVDVFRLKYEYHNAKVIVKAGGAKEENGRLLSGCGRSGIPALREVYETGESTEVPKALADAVDEAKTTLARTGNPQLADFILDRAYFAELSALAERSKNSFIEGYVQLLIDSANLRIAVRMQAIGKSADGALIPGGTIPPEDVERAMDSRDTLNQLYASTPFAPAVAAGDMTGFELAADNVVNRYLAEAERVAFGPAVVVEYLAAVENEIMAIRIILTGRKMNIDPKLLRERLRECYV